MLCLIGCARINVAMQLEQLCIEVSYIEIYNDAAYDLLNAVSGTNARLPKVHRFYTNFKCIFVIEEPLFSCFFKFLSKMDMLDVMTLF